MCVLVNRPPPHITHRPDRIESVCGRSLPGIVGSKLVRSWCLFLLNVEILSYSFMDRNVQCSGGDMWLWSLKYEMALAHCGGFRHGKNQKQIFYYFDSVQISEQFTYNVTSGKAVLPRYLRQGGTNFVLCIQFFSKHKNAINISCFWKTAASLTVFKQFIVISSVVSPFLAHFHTFF